MAQLDTRGFMDGALKGFDVMSRYQDRQADRARQKSRDAAQDEMNAQQMSLREAQANRQEQQDLRSAEAHKAQYGYTDESGKKVKGSFDIKQDQESQAFKQQYGYTDESGKHIKGTAERTFDQNQSLNNARVKQSLSQTKLNEIKAADESKRLKREEKKQLRVDNANLTKQKWLDAANGSFDDKYFDQDFIKGTEQDIRVWDDEKVEQLESAITNLRGIVSGESNVNSDTALRSFESLYKDLLSKSEGSIDTSNGKTIKKFTVERINMESDINPEVPGDQGGLVVLGKVTYDDGTTALKPVTQGRSTDPDDPVKVIPVEEVLSDLTQRRKMARVAIAAKKGGLVFAKKTDDKDFAQKKELKYVDKMAELTKSKNQDISKLLRPTPEDIAEVEARYAEAEKDLKQQLFKDDSGSRKGQFSSAAIEWAEGNPINNIDDGNKMQFLSDLTRKGYDISNMTPEVLEKQYQRLMAARKQQWNAQQQPQQAPQPQAPGLSSSKTNAQSVINSILQQSNP